MPKFNYVALDARGTESVGVVEAASPNEAISQLRQSGYFPTSVVEEGKGGARKAPTKKAAKSAIAAAPSKKSGGGIVLFAKKTVKSKTLMVFTRQLATLIDAGLPLLRGLTVLSKQERDPVLKATINQLADSVQGGNTFSESLAQHPKIFNKLYINMVKAGELGGVLELVLNRLAEFQEKAQKIANKVKSAMAYPVIVLVIAVLIMWFLLVFIVPKFEQIFKDKLGNKPLPELTQIVIGISKAVQDNFMTIIGTFVAVIIVYNLFASSAAGRVIMDRIKLHVPMLGDLLRKSSISRFTRTLGTLVESGVPILQALTITKDTAGNAVISDAIIKVHDAVKEGESIVAPLEASGVFPPIVISMIDVGEETGQLPAMLLKVADVFDDEVDNAVASLTSMLEPLMIVVLALIVGSIVIALFMPLISIIQEMQNQS